MASIRDVRAARETLVKFRRKNGVFTEEEMTKDPATQLFRNICKGLEGNLSDDDRELPPEAEERLKTFLEFVSRNGH